MSKFGTITNSSQVTELHGLIRPYLLRRLKEDVETKMPPKEETIVEVELTTDQKKYYRAIYERNTKILLKGSQRCVQEQCPYMVSTHVCSCPTTHTLALLPPCAVQRTCHR